MGVKNGLKDVGRTLDIDFTTMNNITKKIDEITDSDPGITFKSIDKLKEGNSNEQLKYKEFVELDNQHKEVFRLARAFEGTPRSSGVHASGILVTPFPVNDLFPTRTDDDGSLVTLYDGVTVEQCGGCKLDMLGLKTLDILNLTIKSYDENSNIYDLYNIVDNYLDNKEMFDLLKRKETEGIFQFGSDLFKGLIEDIPPNSIEDISSITAIGRPGPLSANMNKIYAKIKLGEIEAKEPLRGTWNIVSNSDGVIIYQEHVMRIAQVVAGFDDNQADSFLRKAVA